MASLVPSCSLFPSRFAQILCIAFDPLGDYLATSSADGTVRIWDMRDDPHTIKTITVCARVPQGPVSTPRADAQSQRPKPARNNVLLADANVAAFCPPLLSASATAQQHVALERQGPLSRANRSRLSRLSRLFPLPASPSPRLLSSNPSA
eukprot:3729338-Pleurochrysis_carterae.AAC.1